MTARTQAGTPPPEAYPPGAHPETYPPEGYPPEGYAPEDYSRAEYPPEGYPSGGYPADYPEAYPQEDYPPVAYPPGAYAYRSGDRDAALREDIERTRAELGETLQELMTRADVRTRARLSAGRVADRARATLRTPTPWLALASGIATVVILARVTNRRWWESRMGGRW